ncbi:MAG: hypothetical protein KDC44_14780 [Phaeodactylibacter sp.]|nr:hypothetical protein [Phaeodactylibacter sp.]
MTKQPTKGRITGNNTWRDFFKNTYLSYYDLTGDLVVEIKEMRYETVTGPGGRKDDCLIMAFTDPDVLPMVVNSTNAKTISDLHGTNKPAEWVGKSITLYPDNSVKMKGETVGGIRIRPVVPSTKKSRLTPDRFDKMVQQIIAGNFSVERALAQFDLTDEQLETLKGFQE